MAPQRKQILSQIPLRYRYAFTPPRGAKTGTGVLAITSRRGWRLPPSEFRQVSCLVITVFPGGQTTSNRFLGILVRMDRLDDHHTNTSRSNFWKFSRGGLRLPGRSDDFQESDIQQGGQRIPGRSGDLQRSYCPAVQ